MTPERWQQINQIFHSALERNPGDRAAFLAEACASDEELRREVESLLASDETAETSMAAIPAGVAAEWFAEGQAKPVTAGQMIGHYRICSALGAGGMGEVYLAQDTRLGRKIALKLLPAKFTRDEDLLRRFEREARAASALNHPNIVTVHEIGQAGNLHYIVTELIEGQTLRRRLADGPMPIGEALDVAAQVASALDASHQAGVVHRDIKPENIMLRRDGYVKVLDFGIAKLIEGRTSSSDAEALTVDDFETEKGAIIGTVAYMSPEQARALKDIDARTDIFSLGTALYEMIAGRSPFASPTIVETLAAILHFEPLPLATYRPDIPPELEKIVARALRKCPEERYQTAAELRHGLQSLKQELEIKAKLGQSLRPSHGGKAEVTERIRAGQPVWHRIAIIAALVMILAVAAGYLFYRTLIRNPLDSHTKATQKPPTFQTVETPVTTSGNVVLAAISRNGKYIAYAEEKSGQQRLLLKESGAEPTEIVKSDNVLYDGLTFSPDGESVYYVLRRSNEGSGVLYRAHTLEGFKQELVKGIDTEVTFSPDGERIAFGREGQGQSSLIVANSDGSEEDELASHKLADYFCLRGLAWSPNGEEIACSSVSDENLVNVVAVRVSDGKERSISNAQWRDIKGMAWLDDGRGLIVVAAEWDAQNSQVFYLTYPSGEAQQITSDLNEYNGVSLATNPERLVTTITTTQRYSNIWIMPANGERREVTPIIYVPGKYNDMSWTPDGKIIVSQNVKDGLNLVLMDTNGRNHSKLTSDSGLNFRGRVSSDGRYIVYVSNQKGAYNIWRLDRNGSRMQLTTGRGEYAPSLTPDGKWVFYWSDASGQRLVWKVPIDGGTPEPFTNVPSWKPVVSPKGDYVACYYLDKKTSRYKAAVIPILGGQPIKQFDLPDSIIQWRPDGKALSYFNVRGGTSNIWVQPLDGGRPKQLTKFEASSVLAQIRFFDWSWDGRQIAVLRASQRRSMVLRRD
jgi:eukaryotic-like serine/threonine-protein kinase